MKRSRLSDYRVKKIISHFCVDVDATKASLLLGMSRATINRYYLEFRELIWQQRQEEKRLLVGIVEVDESYFGRGRPRGVAGPLRRGRGTLKKPVFGIFERNGQVYTEVVPDCSKKTLHDIILGRVALESAIHSDSWRGYDGLVDVGFDKHLRVKHGENEFSKGKGIHINGIESFWSFTKRRLSKFNGIAPQMFVLHLKECEWRWNKNVPQMEKELFKLFKTLRVSNSSNNSDDYVIFSLN
jgi:transposase